MNCQDISRIVDGDSIGELTAAERSAAESHALSCRDCAPAWGVQSRLSAVRVPATPPEVAARFRALAGLPDLATRRHTMRRFTLIGSLVVLAAAAAILATRWLSNHTTERQLAATVTHRADLSPLIDTAVTQTPPVGEAGAPAAPETAATAGHSDRLPLLLPTEYPPEPRAMQDMNENLQKAVELHPELIEGPPTEEMFVVTLVLRTDGSVVSSIAKQVARRDYLDVNFALDRTLPNDGGDGGYDTGFKKGTSLRDGRSLRADVVLKFRAVPDSYDVTRSSMRVDQLVRARHRDLLRAGRSDAVNRLTILLTEDGQIDREQLELAQAGDSASASAGKPDYTTRLAGQIARRLGIGIDQIGLMGNMSVEEGSRITKDEDGEPQRNDKWQSLIVDYAWPRRPGETAPRLGQGVARTPVQEKFDEVAARAIVEKLIPDAFTLKNSVAGEPIVVLSAKGEVLGAGHLDLGNTIFPSRAVLQNVARLVPGSHPETFEAKRVTSSSGAVALVTFAWEDPAPVPGN